MAVSITSVDSDDSITATQEDVEIVGTGFGEEQGTGVVELVDGAITSEQTVTAWGDTSITISVVLGNVRYGSRTIKVTNDSAENNTLAVAVTVPSGVNYVNLAAPIASTGQYVTELGTLEDGDQLEWSGVQVGVIGDVTVTDDSTYTWAAAVHSFLVRYHDGTEWSAYASEDKEFTNQTGVSMRHGIKFNGTRK